MNRAYLESLMNRTREPYEANPFGVTYYVDSTNGAAINDGLEPDNALLTIQSAMDKAATARGRVTIYVAPGGYTEDLTTPLNAVAPFGRLIAWNPTPGRSFGAVWLTASTAGQPCLGIRARGWLIKGFEFDALADAACVLLDGSVSGRLASGTVFEDCLFVGANQGLYGIQVNNAITNAALCAVRNCGFYGFTSGSTDGACMQCTNTSNDAPRFWLVEDCWFGDSDNLIKDMSFKECIVRNNTFLASGANQSPTEKLKNTNGSNSNFYGNSFGGVYTPAGGYTAGSGDDWAGNTAEDVAGEAANGWTYKIPAN